MTASSTKIGSQNDVLEAEVIDYELEKTLFDANVILDSDTADFSSLSIRRFL